LLDALEHALFTRAQQGQRDPRGLIAHNDRGSTYTADDFTKLCRKLGVRQSMGRVGHAC